MEYKQIFHELELFNGLNDAEIDKIVELCTVKTVQSGDTLVYQGEPGNEMFIITHGLFEISRRSEDDAEEQTLVRLGAGQTVGEMALLDRGVRSASVRAVEPSKVIVINRDDFDALCKRNTGIGYVVMRNIAIDLSFRQRYRYLRSE